jgi:hypothetical protein
MRPGAHIHSQRPRLLGALLAVAVSLVVPALPAQAAPAGATTAEVSRLEAECARLRAELDRANADVAALKRERGVRNDYRLRQRLADAEALARKLTDAEAQLRTRVGTPAAPRAPALAPPSAQPGDGPVELEAKADLLSDQARRLAGEAEELARTAGQLRGRQTLRKRAYQLERDPFAAVDGSKRTLIFGSARAATNNGKATGENSPPKSPQPAGDSSQESTRGGAGGSSGGSSGPAMGAPTMPPPSTTGGGNAPGAAPPPTQTPTTAPPTPPPSGAGDFKGSPAPVPQPTGALSSQLRTLLDPSTLSEVQRLERTGKPITDPEALEKLAAALRQRAQALDAQAKSLRARARP